jgi:hypothetical protein
MRKAKLTAFCGMMTALGVVLMAFVTVIPELMYVLPVVTGIIVLLVCDVGSKRWAWGVFFATSVLSFVLLTDKESVLIYILFFGYYPLIRERLSQLPKAVFVILKFLMFNCAAILTGVAGVWLFGVPKEEYGEFGKLTIPLLLGLANVVFILYDRILVKYKIVFDVISSKLRKTLR